MAGKTLVSGKTLYDKVWDAHVVHAEDSDMMLLYIDRHLVHEVTSPQAFEGLQLAGRRPWRTDSMLAVADHNVPTTSRSEGIDDPVARLQVETLDKNWHLVLAHQRLSMSWQLKPCCSRNPNPCWSVLMAKLGRV